MHGFARIILDHLNDNAFGHEWWTGFTLVSKDASHQNAAVSNGLTPGTSCHQSCTGMCTIAP